jgi:hypothetical protein
MAAWLSQKMGIGSVGGLYNSLMHQENDGILKLSLKRLICLIYENKETICPPKVRSF